MEVLRWHLSTKCEGGRMWLESGTRDFVLKSLALERLIDAPIKQEF